MFSSWKLGKLLGPTCEKTVTLLLHGRWIRRIKPRNIEFSLRNYPGGTEWLAKVWGAPEKTSLGRILPSPYAIRQWE